MGEKIVIVIGLVFALFFAWLVGSLFWHSLIKDNSDQTILKTIAQIVVGAIVLGTLGSILRSCGLNLPDGV
jgi:hypothetical protein